MSGLSNASTSKLETFLVLHPRISFRLKNMQTSAQIIAHTTAQRVSPESFLLDNPLPNTKEKATSTYLADPSYPHSTTLL
jgi:hypothetical protein